MTDLLEKFAAVPIPTRLRPNALHYGHVPVDEKAPEQAEPLVYLDEYRVAADAYYARGDGQNPPHYRMFLHAPRRPMVRRGVAERLARVNTMLATAGLELLVLDAHRPVEFQSELWSYFLERARDALPEGTEAAHRAWAGDYCSDPSRFSANDQQTWPTHCTGGAVDVTLRRKDGGDWLYMGGIFDDPSPISHTAFYETAPRPFGESQSGREARRNRRLLVHAMAQQDFVNYHLEWWHFDYGTQMSIHNSGSESDSAAIYSAIGAID